MNKYITPQININEVLKTDTMTASKPSDHAEIDNHKKMAGVFFSDFGIE